MFRGREGIVKDRGIQFFWGTRACFELSSRGSFNGGSAGWDLHGVITMKGCISFADQNLQGKDATKEFEKLDTP